MQLHNRLHRATALQSAYEAALGEKDEEFSGIERAGETLTPVIDLWSLPEWRYLRRERMTMFGTTEAAQVALRSRLAIRNPSANMIVIVESIQNRGLVGPITPTIGTGLTVDSSENMRPTDSRWYTPTTGAGVATVTHRAGAIGGSTTAWGAVYILQGATYQLDAVLGPGWFLSFDPGTDNLLIALTFRVRERPALPGELGL